MAGPLLIPAIAAGLGVAGGYLQYRKGMKEAKRIDEMGMESMAEARLPEYADVEAEYKQIKRTGLGSAETNEFLRRSASAQYAQQLAAQTMAGGSLARYTLALNNANMIANLGALSAQNFQRKMQGLSGLERNLAQKQARVDADVQMENQRRLAAGQAAAGLAQQGLQNVIGGLTSFATSAMAAGSGGGGTEKTISDTNYGTPVTKMAPRAAVKIPQMSDMQIITPEPQNLGPIAAGFTAAPRVYQNMPIWSED